MSLDGNNESINGSSLDGNDTMLKDQALSDDMRTSANLREKGVNIVQEESVRTVLEQKINAQDCYVGLCVPRRIHMQYKA